MHSISIQTEYFPSPDNPGILTMASPTVSLHSTTPTTTDFKESSPANRANSFNCATPITGIAPHYPLFYNPYIHTTPSYMVPTIQVSEPAETKEDKPKEDAVKVEEDEVEEE
jgi:hypothetical protein